MKTASASFYPPILSVALLCAVSLLPAGCGDDAPDLDEPRADIIEQADTTAPDAQAPEPEAPDTAEPGARGSISGKVTVDGQAVDELEVRLRRGDTLELAETTPDGEFTFKDLAHGTYLISAQLASTRELRREIAVEVLGDTPMPTLAFSGLGKVRGVIKDLDGEPLNDAAINVLGTTLSASSDERGAFEISDIPTGSWTLSAHVEVGPENHISAESATVEVIFNQVSELDLSLDTTEAPPPTGPAQITGSVAFHGVNDPSEITVSVPALDLETQAGENGYYEFEVPAGTWEVWAEAPYYPPQMIEEFSVEADEYKLIQPYMMTLYEPLPEVSEADGAWSLVPREQYHDVIHPALMTSPDLLLRYRADETNTYYLFEHQTQEIRPLAVGAAPPILSPNSKYAVFREEAAAQILNIDDSSSFEVQLPEWVEALSFDTDSALLLATGEDEVTGLFRVRAVELQTEESTDLIGHDTVQYASPELIRTSPDGEPAVWVALVQGLPELFHNVPKLEHYQFDDSKISSFYGREDCADPACSLFVWHRTDSSATKVEGYLFQAQPSIYSSGGHWARHQEQDESDVLIDLLNATAYELPSGLQIYQIGPRGERAIFKTVDQEDFYISPLPVADYDAMTALPGVSSSSYPRWTSPTRVFMVNSTQEILQFDDGQLVATYDEPSNTHQLFWGAVSWNYPDGDIYVALEDQPIIRLSPPDHVDAGDYFWITTETKFVEQGDDIFATAGNRLLITWSDGSSSFIKDGQLLRTDFSAAGMPQTDAVYGSFELFFVTSLNATPQVFEFDTGHPFTAIEPGSRDLQMSANPRENYTLILMERDPNLPVSERYKFAVIPANFDYLPPVPG